MPLQLIKDGRLAEWIGKTTIFLRGSGCGDGNFAAEPIATKPAAATAVYLTGRSASG
jgi:hypothetical protein